MNIHPSIHLDFARERQPESVPQAERQDLVQLTQEAITPRLRLVARVRPFGRSVLLWCKTWGTGETSRTPCKADEPSGTLCEADAWEAPTMRPDQISRVTFRELAHRVDGGIDVTLLWSARENRLAVTVFDERAGELLVLNAESDRALDVFYHPYAHSASQLAA
jgi:hypothetical protein